MKYKEIANNKEINAYLKKGNENLGQLGLQIIHRHIASRWHIRQENSSNALDMRNMRLNLQKLPDICMISAMRSTENIMRSTVHFLQMIC